MKRDHSLFYGTTFMQMVNEQLHKLKMNTNMKRWSSLTEILTKLSNVKRTW